MTTDKLMNDFLMHSVTHLLNNNKAFLDKLEKGDISAIKMLLEFINKTAPKAKPAKGKATVETSKFEDMKYDQAFETLKDTLEENVDGEAE